MRIELTSDAREFQRAAAEFLMRDPLRHNVITSVLGNQLSGMAIIPTTFASVQAAGTVIGVAMQTVGRSVELGDLPDPAIADLAAAFAERSPDAPGVEGSPGAALVFAEQWSSLRGSSFRLEYATRLYRLGDLLIPQVSGIARRATESDLDVCVQWCLDMARETGIQISAAAIRTRIAVGGCWLWDDGQRPVAMAAHQAPAFGWARIGPVYTPPRQRGHGYASALTADVSRRLRDGGSGVCLFADLANATSNKIYQAIGYEPVRNFVHYEFC